MTAKVKPKSIDAHITYLRGLIDEFHRGLPVLEKARDVCKLGLIYYDKEKDRVGYMLQQHEIDNWEAKIGVLTLGSAVFTEFVQFWEQHKLLSEYVDSDVRAEFRRKQREIIRRYEPIYRGINGYLDRLKENKRKYQGGVGDI